MKLTQKEIIEHMQNGWELGMSSSAPSFGRWWLQKPHLCQGGETKDVYASSAYALVRKGLIKSSRKSKDAFWLSRYILV